MDFITLFTLAIGLSMDAFAVSVCKGLAIKKLTLSKMAVVGLWFGGFQGLMPAIGYLLGIQFRSYITTLDHWIAFVLLLVIGLKMLKEARESSKSGEGEQDLDESLKPGKMFVLAVATSIDALAVGITFAFLKTNIVTAVSFIGVTTFALSMLGVKAGNLFGTKYKAAAEYAGGFILILLGIKILLEHLSLF